VKLIKSSQTDSTPSTKRAQNGKAEEPTKKRKKTGKKQTPRCRSRTDPTIDPAGCHFEHQARGCSYNNGKGHMCISCGKDHTAGACQAAGSWNVAKQTAYANGTLN